MWRAGFGLVVAVGCASCLDIPGHRTTDAGPTDARFDAGPDGPRQPIAPLMMTGDEDNPLTVTTTDGLWRVVFPGPSQTARLPDSVEIGGAEILGSDEVCVGEDRVGIALFPAGSISSRIDNADDTGVFIERTGAAVIQIRVTWAAPLDCPDPAGVRVTGSIGFSFYPDGRIVRFDDINVPSPLPNGGACQCSANATGYFITSYLSVGSDNFQRLRWQDSMGNNTSTLPLSQTQDTPNPYWACLDDAAGGVATRRLGIAWDQPNAGGEDDGTRIRRDDNVENTVLLWDWFHGSPGVPMGSLMAHTAWLLGTGPAPCDDDAMTAAAGAFKNPQPLSIDGDTRVVQVNRAFGMYFWDPGMNRTKSTWTLRTTAEVQKGFALSLLFPTNNAVTVSRNGTMLIGGLDYLDQPAEEVAAGTVYRHNFWIRDGLGPTDSLTLNQ